jgi:hypothetical protein
LDYADFCKAAELMKTKAHLTARGLEQIRKLKTGMNTGRKMSTWARPLINPIRKDLELMGGEAGSGCTQRELRSITRYFSDDTPNKPYKGRYIMKKISRP